MASQHTNAHPFHSAVILAAGSGSRMGANVTKQWLEIGGLPVVVRTLLSFSRCTLIDEIIVVAKAEEMQQYPALLRKYNITKVKKIVRGSNTRQKSAMAGLNAVDERSRFLSIHDAARCLITPEMIEKVALTAYRTRAAAAGCPAKDTIKLVDDNLHIRCTPDRGHAWLAATPQTFQTELYRACAYTAKARGITATDDCMLAEACGFSVTMVDCGQENIKITTPQDLVFANAILQSRQAQQEQKPNGGMTDDADRTWI